MHIYLYRGHDNVDLVMAATICNWYIQEIWRPGVSLRSLSSDGEWLSMYKQLHVVNGHPFAPITFVSGGLAAHSTMTKSTTKKYFHHGFASMTTGGNG
jgi:hypothetical protein